MSEQIATPRMLVAQLRIAPELMTDADKDTLIPLLGEMAYDALERALEEDNA